MHNLLLDEPPLVVLPSLAKAIGLNEAIVLQQVHYWLVDAMRKNRQANFKQERWWVFNSYEEWQQAFPFWSDRTIQRTFLALEKTGLVLSAQLSDELRDRRKWYTIDYERYREIIEEAIMPDCRDVSCQHGTIHGANMALSTMPKRHHGPRQLGTMNDEAETTAETTPKTTADSRVCATKPEPQDLTPVAAELVSLLVGEGVNRADALRLAQEYPGECRRQLSFLPFVTEFTSTKGAYLRTAVEQGFGPPKAFLEAEAARAKQEQAQRAAHARQARETHRQQQEREKGEQLAAIRAKLQSDPDTWAQVQAEAEKQLPAPLRGKVEHVAYQPALEARINAILAEEASGG